MLEASWPGPAWRWRSREKRTLLELLSESAATDRGRNCDLRTTRRTRHGHIERRSLPAARRLEGQPAPGAPSHRCSDRCCRDRPHRTLCVKPSDSRSVLRSDEYCELAPAQVWARLPDDGIYLCSISTVYRLLTIVGENRERRRQRTHPARKKPELLARPRTRSGRGTPRNSAQACGATTTSFT